MKISPVARHSLFLLASVSSNALVVVMLIIAMMGIFQHSDRIPAQLVAACLLAFTMAVPSTLNPCSLLELLSGRGEQWVNTAAGPRLVSQDNGQPDRPADRGLFAHDARSWGMEAFYNPVALCLIDLSLLAGTVIFNAWGSSARPLPIGSYVFLVVTMLFLSRSCLLHVRRTADCPGESLLTVLYALMAKRARQTTFLDPASGRVRRVHRLPGEAASPVEARAPRGALAPRTSS